MAITRSATITLAFADATSRKFKFNGIDQSAIINIKRKVVAINENMPASFKTTFVSDIGAECIMISAAEVTATDEEVIYSAS